jgi:O-antigen ligase
MNIEQKKIDTLNYPKHVSILFMAMTFSAIVPLYFESVRQVFGLIFISILFYLSVVAYRTPLHKVNSFEKRWLFIAVVYAVILIVSYFIRPPYTSDGEWRNAAPIFVLLISAWYFLAIRFNQQKELIKYIAISSVACALVLLIIEIYMAESLIGYRLGVVYDGARGLAATGFILPITTGLLVVLWLKERSPLFLLLLLISFVLSGMNGSNTTFSITSITILFGLIYVFIWGNGFNNRTKSIIITLLIAVLLASTWFAKPKITAAANDVIGIMHGDYATSTGLRYAMFNIGLKALEDSWLLGVGPSKYKTHIANVAGQSNYPESVKEFSYGVMQLHNQYIMSFLLAGIVGGITLLFLLLYPVKVFLSNFRQTRDPAAFIMSGMMVGIVFVMFFGAIFTYTYTTIFYMLAISVLISWFSGTKGDKN